MVYPGHRDVAEAGTNYSSVNLPFALGYVYAHDFEGAAGWQFDPSIFKAPFFPGAGFVGVKYLASPTGSGVINLFSNTINQGAFDDARPRVPDLTDNRHAWRDRHADIGVEAKREIKVRISHVGVPASQFHRSRLCPRDTRPRACQQRNQHDSSNHQRTLLGRRRRPVPAGQSRQHGLTTRPSLLIAVEACAGY